MFCRAGGLASVPSPDNGKAPRRARDRPEFRLAREEITYIANHADAKMIFVDEELAFGVVPCRPSA